jgi:hypothetical protein
MARGAMTELSPESTDMPTVKTRKKVPMNSMRYFFMTISMGEALSRT